MENMMTLRATKNYNETVLLPGCSKSEALYSLLNLKGKTKGYLNMTDLPHLSRMGFTVDVQGNVKAVSRDLGDTSLMKNPEIPPNYLYKHTKIKG